MTTLEVANAVANDPEICAIIAMDSILAPFDNETRERLAAYMAEKHGVTTDRTLAAAIGCDPSDIAWNEATQEVTIRTA